MRLWHESLIAKLPRAQLLGQHRECAALRGNGWGKKHATVDYVFTHSPYKLYQYHVLIMDEMRQRGYQPDERWYQANFRGNRAPAHSDLTPIQVTTPLYPEHDEAYLAECLANLATKGIYL